MAHSVHQNCNFRCLYCGYDVRAFPNWFQLTVEHIIRNRLKVVATIGNARRVIEAQEAFGSFDNYIWRFVDGRPIANRFTSLAEIPATSDRSDAMSKDLKKRGFKFVGSTICYAFMQAVGMVNDHQVDCFR